MSITQQVRRFVRTKRTFPTLTAHAYHDRLVITCEGEPDEDDFDTAVNYYGYGKASAQWHVHPDTGLECYVFSK